LFAAGAHFEHVNVRGDAIHLVDSVIDGGGSLNTLNATLLRTEVRADVVADELVLIISVTDGPFAISSSLSAWHATILTGAINNDPAARIYLASSIVVAEFRLVTTTPSALGSEIRIEVKDTGRGIAREHLTTIFERFRQLDGGRTRDHGGLGLGLAVVRHLVDAHGGHVGAASAGLGHGSTFTVTLPVHRGTQPPLVKTSEAMAQAGALPGCACCSSTTSRTHARSSRKCSRSRGRAWCRCARWRRRFVRSRIHCPT
jgi:hypothetical protein